MNMASALCINHVAQYCCCLPEWWNSSEAFLDHLHHIYDLI